MFVPKVEITIFETSISLGLINEVISLLHTYHALYYEENISSFYFAFHLIELSIQKFYWFSFSSNQSFGDFLVQKMSIPQK